MTLVRVGRLADRVLGILVSGEERDVTAGVLTGVTAGSDPGRHKRNEAIGRKLRATVSGIADTMEASSASKKEGPERIAAQLGPCPAEEEPAGVEG